MIGRLAAIAAVVIVAVAVAVVLLSAGGKNYEVNALFQNASQVVKGGLVQVAGRPVGKVKDITLTDDGQAKLKLQIDDDYAPLRLGTTATVRQSSLSSIANRYIDLRLAPANRPKIPSGGTLDQSHTTTAVDLDQIFNVFGPRERKALSGVIRGFGETYAGRGRQANRGFLYLNPSLAATSRLFSELTYDKPTLRRFVNQSADLVRDIDERRDDLAGLITNLDATTGAINRQHDALAEAISRLPDFMRRADTTFVNLRATLNDLDPLVNESKPVAKKLRPFLAELRPLARDARPTLRDLSRLVRRPGARNDLIDLTRSNVPVRDIAIGPVQANGKEREGAFPASTKALRGATPELAFARPYAPDLTAWFDDYSNSGIYDALGGVGRVALNVNLFTIVNGLPNTIIPPDQRAQVFGQTATLNYRDRCPGSSERDPGDGSTPYKPTPDFNCDPTEVPPP